MRIFALLHFWSEAGIHLNEFQAFNCMIQLGRGLGYKGIGKPMPINLNLKEDAFTNIIYQ